MKLPSLDYLFRNAAATLGRFPWVLGMAAMATGLAIALNESARHSPEKERLAHFLLAAYLGISLHFGLSMLLERLRPRAAIQVLVHATALGLLTLYAWTLGAQPEFVIGARYALFLLASHLFVAVAPWLSLGHTGGFWEYNHRLFLRILLAGVFSACLYAGVAGALAAVKHLFSAPVPDKAFLYLWLTITGVFNTWFFLAGVPDDFRELDLDHPYPRALKVLAQYILLPVVTLYLLILYAYAAKILLRWEWPIGWVSYLVLVCALLGILSLLLVHPIQERHENRWVKLFSRGFHLALFPLLVLLFAAIGRRIADYRITENRYFVAALACWLTGIALYFTFSRVRNIKVVPITLGLLALSTSFGPWGAFQVSLRSQTARLEGLLESQGRLSEGRLVGASPSARKVDEEAEIQIGAVLDWLERRRRLDRLGPWVPDTFEVAGVLSDKHALLKHMGLEYVVADRHGRKAGTFRNYAVRGGEARSIAGFDYYLGDVSVRLKDSVFVVAPPPHLVEARLDLPRSRISLTLRGDSLAVFDLRPLLAGLKAEHAEPFQSQVPMERMYLEQRASGYRVGLQVQHMHAQDGQEGLQYLQASLFLGLPPGP